MGVRRRVGYRSAGDAHVPIGVHVAARRADARGVECARGALRRLPQSCRGSLPSRSRPLLCWLDWGCVATIECVKDRGGAWSQCRPPRRLDRHGYIDMGTDSAHTESAWSPGPHSIQHQERFMAPPAPLPLPAHHRWTSHCLPTGTLPSLHSTSSKLNPVI